MLVESIGHLGAVAATFRVFHDLKDRKYCPLMREKIGFRSCDIQNEAVILPWV
jgi:hypothetical protein